MNVLLPFQALLLSFVVPSLHACEESHSLARQIHFIPSQGPSNTLIARQCPHNRRHQKLSPNLGPQRQLRKLRAALFGRPFRPLIAGLLGDPRDLLIAL